MKLSKQEKESARSGCHFYYGGYCLNDVRGRSFCVCLKVARDAKKPNKKENETS